MKNWKLVLGLLIVAIMVSACVKKESSTGSVADSKKLIVYYSLFPQITNLNNRDDRFKQFISDVEANWRRTFNYINNRGNENAQSIADSLTIYIYTPRENEDLFFLANRCNIPYHTLATLNRITHPSMVEAGKPLLLPTIPGIFILDKPESSLEQLLANSHMSSGDSVQIEINRAPGIHAGKYHFYPGRDFNHTERAFFLNGGSVVPDTRPW